ncbi:MAG: D-amino acid dehydrogenase small subunit [Pseudomonadota bacterium]
MNLFETSRQVTVLGAGMVGVSCALALQAKGWSVTLVDQQAPGEETSHGNAGVISRSSLLPFNRPGLWQNLPAMLLRPGANLKIRPSALSHWQWMWRFLWHAKRSSFEVTTVALDGLIQLSSDTHRAWLKKAHVESRLRDTGWLWLYAHAAAFESGAASREVLQEFGVACEVLNALSLQALEPHLAPAFSHALWVKDATSVDNPRAVVKAYVAQFLEAGGQLVQSKVIAMQQQPSGWQWVNPEGGVHWTPNIVVAMGPWSESLLEASQLQNNFKVNMGFERGYHRHFQPVDGVRLGRPIYDLSGAYVLSPMKDEQGADILRMTTGVELAARDEGSNLQQLECAENAARRVLPMRSAVPGSDWLGARPTTPDSRPVIGEVPNAPGLWLAFGHQHIGFSTGPGTGVLLSQLMSKEATSIDPRPFAPQRF